MRASHKKSRQGCLACKKRHVKCDEQKPACANCTIASRDCSYPESAINPTVPKRKRKARARQPDADGQGTAAAGGATGGGGSAAAAAAPTAPKPASPATDVSSSAASSSSFSSSSAVHSPSGSSVARLDSPGASSVIRLDSPSPVAFSSSTTCGDHMLELELIHTWSIETWTGMEVLPGCESLLRVNFVRESLEHRFMMDAIFALAATHRAYSHRQSGDTAGYLRYDYASIRYGNKASEGFRVKLQTATPDDLHLLYYFASMASVLNLLVCRQYRSTMDCFDVSMTLFLGSFRSTETNLDWIQKSDHSVAVRAEMMETPAALFDGLPPATKDALDRLQRVGDTVRVPRGILPRDPLATEIAAYRRAIAQAKASFAQRAAGQVPGFFFTITAVGGRELAAAVAAREPFSLFIHLYGLVLMNEAGASGGLWWVGTIAKSMAEEIIDILSGTEMGQMEDVQEVIRWARDQVGLPPAAMPLSPPILIGESFEIVAQRSH